MCDRVETDDNDSHSYLCEGATTFVFDYPGFVKFENKSTYFKDPLLAISKVNDYEWRKYEGNCTAMENPVLDCLEFHRLPLENNAAGYPFVLASAVAVFVAVFFV